MTAFVSCFGLFEFLLMPFRLRNAGAAYCRLVQAVVDKINYPGLSAYLDDLILHVCDPDGHVDLLEAHYQSGIKLKAKKTILFEQLSTILGSKWTKMVSR